MNCANNCTSAIAPCSDDAKGALRAFDQNVGGGGKMPDLAVNLAGTASRVVKA